MSERDRMGYRGYYLVRILGGAWAISKDGFHIGYAPTLEAAKKIVDMLV